MYITLKSCGNYIGICKLVTNGTKINCTINSYGNAVVKGSVFNRLSGKRSFNPELYYHLNPKHYELADKNVVYVRLLTDGHYDRESIVNGNVIKANKYRKGGGIIEVPITTLNKQLSGSDLLDKFDPIFGTLSFTSDEYEIVMEG